MSTLQPASRVSVLWPAAAVDSDGVINEERDYFWRVRDFHLLPGGQAGLRRLQAADHALVVATNQPGISHRLCKKADFQALNARMRDRLAAEGVALDGAHNRPHHPTADLGDCRHVCDCRKHGPGLLLEAAAEQGLDAAGSVLVSNERRSTQTDRPAGLARRVRVTSDHAVDLADRAAADALCDCLEAAAAWLLHVAPDCPSQGGR